MAHILIVTVGTRGDVVPFAALGSALRAAGHRVTLVTHGSLRRHTAGLGFVPLPVELGPDVTATGLARTMAGSWAATGRAVMAAARDADLLLLGAMGWIGYHVAEALGVPSMGAFLQPLEPTRAFPPALLTTRSLGGWGNHAAARWFRLAGQAPFARQTAALRREWGLPPLGPRAAFRRMDEERWPVLHGFSPSVVPVPDGWPPHRPFTGYWWPVAGDGLSPRLREFLDAGEPPVYVGFGSMTAPPGMERILAGLDRRIVVSGLRVDRPGVLTVEDEPHDQLFPRVAAVVHHAGAGTTAAALRAGVPSVCLPVTADQPFWAHRLAALGAAPPPLRRPAARRLAEALAATESCRGAAAAVAGRLAGEDGAGVAVAEVEKALAVR